uniref:Uncharacterized protein n=1 Tax=viral metagenome TaxID=1070528 RepID=A0A6C0BM27_9ZZZZ
MSQQVPEELLFTIAEFGQVPNGLSAEYIIEEVNRLEPNFNWSSEFIIEYLRSIDPLYPLMAELKKPDVEIIISDDGQFSIAPPEIDDDDSDDEKEMHETEAEIYAILERYDYEYYTDIGTINVITPELKQYNIYGSDLLVDPRPDPLTDRLDRMIKLTVDRLEIIGEDGEFMSDVPIQNDYAYLIEHASPELIQDVFPGLFPSPPTDIDLITRMLEINPSYNLGSLLSWLRIRSNIRRLIANGEADHLFLADLFFKERVYEVYWSEDDIIYITEVQSGRTQELYNAMVERYPEVSERLETLTDSDIYIRTEGEDDEFANQLMRSLGVMTGVNMYVNYQSPERPYQ